MQKEITSAQDAAYSHIVKYTSLFGGVQGLIILIGLVKSKLMALLLGAGGIGFNSLLMSVQNFASQCTNLGISFGAVPTLSEYYDRNLEEQISHNIQIIRLWSMVSAALGLVFCVTLSPFFDVMSFSWGNHTLHYAVLGLAVALAAITAGETAILKATRRLGALARIQVYGALVSLLVSVPLYYYLGQTGVIVAIVAVAFVSMAITIAYSYYYYPLRLKFNVNQLNEGAGMIRLGMAFVGAAIVGSTTEMAIRAFLNIEEGLEFVGFYNVGYMLTITYAGMVFSSLETDYFPRLSAVSSDIEKTNDTANKQIEVSLLLLTPMLVALITMLPILVPLLFSYEFLPVVSMAQLSVLAMYFKVVTMPMAYITLARRRSLSFLFLESAYFAILLAAIVVCYRWWGLWGTGLALVVAHVAELAIVAAYSYWLYGYRSSWSVFRYAVVQLSVGLLAYAVSCVAEGGIYWITEAALTLVSTAYSVYVLRKKTRLWESLKRKFMKPA